MCLWRVCVCVSCFFPGLFIIVIIIFPKVERSKLLILFVRDERKRYKKLFLRYFLM